MVTARDVIAGLYGAFRLARLDRGGARYFDKTVDGFWRSFFAAAIVLPLYVILLALRFGEPGLTNSLFRYLSIEMIAYVTAWVAFPLAALPLSRVFDKEGNYIGFIVAYNWASVLQNAIYLPIAMIVVTNLIPMPYANFISFVALGFIMVYTWFIARVMLDVSAGAAAAMVGMDLILSILIRTFAEGMMRAG
ncbi:MAG: hypothetical protein RIB59_05585 [Rhodospirillales bacterium]